jgi:hypothetical protein
LPAHEPVPRAYALDPWATAQRLSIYDAALDLCQRLNIPLPVLAPPPTGNREEAPVGPHH